MSRYFSYIKSSQKILETYDGLQPFPFHLKKQFAVNKKFGSKDRRIIAEICYAWLRTSHLFQKKISEELIIESLFLCAETIHPLLAAIAPDLNEKVGLPVVEKLAILKLPINNIFPFGDEIGDVSRKEFSLSFLSQPLLFLRLRPGKEKLVLDKLQKAAIPFTEMGSSCISLPNGTKLEELVRLNKEAVVQDKNSQRVFDYLTNDYFSTKTIDVWDCCAASGGKSILLYDKLKTRLKLTVSDIRSSILQNCKQRLQQAAINIHHAFVADVSKPLSNELLERFDIIICDAPCTGSGTWSRTPEQLAFFDEKKIDEFYALQKLIAKNASLHLKQGGLFFYITCSVFKKENEEVVAFLKNTTNLRLINTAYLAGYKDKADTMYVAIFKKDATE